jgi:hypothetical protein
MMNLYVSLKFTRPRLTTNLTEKLNDYMMIVEESIPPMTSLNFVLNMGLSMK